MDQLADAALKIYEVRDGKKTKKIKPDGGGNFVVSSTASEALCFMLAGEKGSVYYINENSKFSKLYQMDSSVVRLLYCLEKSMLISITDKQMLGQYIIRSEYEVKNLMTVKLSGRSNQLDFTWIGTNLLAYAGGENIIRSVGFL